MKTFNQTIKVEVEVDAIAQQLLNKFSEDEKHKETITETIIGNLLKTSNGLSQVYNVLNGYTNEINFKIDDFVGSKDTVSMYVKDKDGKVSRVQARRFGTVLKIDLYSSRKLCIEYKTMNSDGIITKTTDWVNHIDYDKISQFEDIEGLTQFTEEHCPLV